MPETPFRTHKFLSSARMSSPLTSIAASPSGGTPIASANTWMLGTFRKWGGLILMVAAVGGLFLINSLLMYDTLVQVDDEMARFDDYAAPSRALRHESMESLLKDDLDSKQWNLPSFRKTRLLQDKTTSTNRQAIRASRGAQVPLSARQEFERSHPPEGTERIRDFVHSLRDHDFENRNKRSDLPYNIYNCPEEPPEGYPFAWNVIDVLNHWNVDDTNLPESPIHQGLCVFDWKTEQAKAHRYREKELPFVLKNHPEVMATAERWMTPKYLERLLGETPQRTEHGKNNHLMFWRTRFSAQGQTLPPDWKPPTDVVQLSYPQWLQKAKDLELVPDQTKEEHHYFRLNARRRVNPWLYEEMPFFDPEKNDPNAFLIVDSWDHRGINCRFGQRGTIAELHFDSTRNFVVLLGGQRRYILAHPDQCSFLELYDRYHPSGRHSRVNWSLPTEASQTDLAKAKVNEVVLQAGDVLYLPTYWFHFIVSLNTNYQCNARSGVTEENYHFMDECGMGRSEDG
jgi:Cupin-like domain